MTIQFMRQSSCDDRAAPHKRLQASRDRPCGDRSNSIAISRSDTRERDRFHAPPGRSPSPSRLRPSTAPAAQRSADDRVYRRQARHPSGPTGSASSNVDTRRSSPRQPRKRHPRILTEVPSTTPPSDRCLPASALLASRRRRTVVAARSRTNRRGSPSEKRSACRAACVGELQTNAVAPSHVVTAFTSARAFAAPMPRRLVGYRYSVNHVPGVTVDGAPPLPAIASSGHVEQAM